MKSLISYSHFWPANAERCRALVVNFSETIIHLKMSIDKFSADTMLPAVCPKLRVLEGYFEMGVSAFIDAANLQIFVMNYIGGINLELLPSSLEEIWLMDDGGDFHNVRLEPVLRSCPKLKILKVTEKFLKYMKGILPELLKVLGKRKTIVQDGTIIDGVKMIPLQKLILPTQLLSQEELIRVREAVEEVVDVKDYREIIEIEY